MTGGEERYVRRDEARTNRGQEGIRWSGQISNAKCLQTYICGNSSPFEKLEKCEIRNKEWVVFMGNVIGRSCSEAQQDFCLEYCESVIHSEQ